MNNDRAGGACRVLSGGEVYFVTKACVYKGMPDEDDLAMTPDEPRAYDDEVMQLQLSDVSRIRPDVMLCGESMRLPDMCADDGVAFMPVSRPPEGEPGLWILSGVGRGGQAVLENTIPFMDRCRLAAVRMQALVLPDEIPQMLSEYGLKLGDLSATFSATRSGTTVVVLSHGCGMLYMALTALASDAFSTILSGTAEYAGDAWSDADFAFRKLKPKRRQKMKGISSPLGRLKPAAAPVIAAASEIVAAADPQEAAVAEAVYAPVDAQAVPVEQPEDVQVQPVQAAVDVLEAAACAEEPEVQEEPAQEAAVEEPVQEAAAEEAVQEQPQADQKPQKARRPPQKAQGAIDMQRIIADLCTDVEPVTLDKLDASLDEMRALRDIQIAAARRLVNIATAVNKMSRASLEKYAAICEVLK